MAVVNVAINVADAVEGVRAAFEDFGERALPRAVQYSLNVADGMGDYLLEKLADKGKHAVRRGRR